MKDPHSNSWERELDRELKALPEISAPPSLIRNVLSTINVNAVETPRSSWHTWSPALRTSVLIALILFAGVVGYFSWRFSPAIQKPFQQVSATVSTISNTASVLGTATVVVLKSLGPILWLAIAAFLFSSYALCIGAGTLAVRFTLARRSHTTL